MIKKYQQGDKMSYDVSVYLVDTEEELTEIDATNMGTQAYVIQTGGVWILSSDGSWYSMTKPSATPIKLGGN